MKDSNPQFVKCEIVRGQSELKVIFGALGPIDAFICGGFAKWCCSPRKKPKAVNDIDVYSQTEMAFDAACKALESAGFAKGKESPAAICYKDTNKKFLGLFGRETIALEVQIIKPIKQGEIVLTGEPKEILANFDFTVSRVAITRDLQAVADVDFAKDEQDGRLRIKAIHCPVNEVYRIAKYTKKGYFCPIVEVLKLFPDWESRGDDYRSKLMELATKENPSEDEITHLERMLHID